MHARKREGGGKKLREGGREGERESVDVVIPPYDSASRPHASFLMMVSPLLPEIIRNKSLEHLDISELVQEIAPRSR